MILSILVFGFFNFRKKAKCFAGDVGSVSLGYFLIFLMLGCMFHFWQTNQSELILNHSTYNGFDFKYILFLSLYGLDSILTIVQRLYLKENIFKPHRKHLYQLLANELRMPHLLVSLIYAILQILISFYLLNNEFSNIGIVLSLLIGVILYVIIKIGVLKKITIR
jgi:UDP-N-acetylmuramyl pentapeptide phosphotransferase/UDP-N-acetylglucosamine-1-phosphate transferase